MNRCFRASASYAYPLPGRLTDIIFPIAGTLNEIGLFQPLQDSWMCPLLIV